MVNENTNPSWANELVTAGDLSRVESAIRNAEQRTCGEIVPIVVRRSTPVGHVPFVVGLLFCLVLLATNALTHLHATLVEQSFGVVGKGFIACAIFFALIGVSIWLAKLPLVQRLLTSSDDQATSCALRAEVEFFEEGLHRTKDATGVLIFLSLMERRAVVLADEAIAKQVSPETWRDVCNVIVSNARQGKVVDGMIAAIASAGEVLATKFPPLTNNPDELRNHLHMKD